MKFDDSIKDDSFKEKRDENYFDGIEHSSFTKRQSGLKFSNLMGMPVLLSLTGVIVFVVLVGLIVTKTGKSFDSENLKIMDARLKQMEDRLIDLGWLEKKLSGLENQGKKIDIMLTRINDIESNLSARIENISKKLDLSTKKDRKKSQKISKSSGKLKPSKRKQKTALKTSGIYHHVRSGDTLYSIGRIYKLSLKELQSMNPSLAGKRNIYPGQKLRIKEK